MMPKPGQDNEEDDVRARSDLLHVLRPPLARPRSVRQEKQRGKREPDGASWQSPYENSASDPDEHEDRNRCRGGIFFSEKTKEALPSNELVSTQRKSKIPEHQPSQAADNRQRTQDGNGACDDADRRRFGPLPPEGLSRVGCGEPEPGHGDVDDAEGAAKELRPHQKAAAKRHGLPERPFEVSARVYENEAKIADQCVVRVALNGVEPAGRQIPREPHGRRDDRQSEALSDIRPARCCEARRKHSAHDTRPAKVEDDVRDAATVIRHSREKLHEGVQIVNDWAIWGADVPIKLDAVTNAPPAVLAHGCIGR